MQDQEPGRHDRDRGKEMHGGDRIEGDREDGPPRGYQPGDPRRQQAPHQLQDHDVEGEHDDEAMQGGNEVRVARNVHQGAEERRIERGPDDVHRGILKPQDGAAVVAGLVADGEIAMLNAPEDLQLEQEEHEVGDPGRARQAIQAVQRAKPGAEGQASAVAAIIHDSPGAWPG